MRGRTVAAIAGMVATVLVGACTDVSTDPNAVAAIQFDNAGYPSVVVGDSLRDSLGLLLPLAAIALNNDGNPIDDAEIVYSSPDTVLRMDPGGVVFARGLNPGGTATRVFATVGSLQSQSVLLFTVPRADSIAPVAVADTAIGTPALGATISTREIVFSLFGDTVAGRPKMPVQGWLVSFQLRYRGALISPTDSSVAFSWTGQTRRLLSFVDTTDAQGRAGRKLHVQTFRAPEDTIFVVATARRRRDGSSLLRAETRIILRQGTSPSNRVP